MILCMKPDSWPALDYADYGCYCGLGGSGNPVDELDRSQSNCYINSHCFNKTDGFWTLTFELLGAAKCMISVTVMPCSILNAGPSWTTHTRKSMTTHVMKQTKSLHAQVNSCFSFFFLMKLFNSWLSKTNIHFFSFIGSNDECEMFICECDRKAAECFGISTWHPEHEHLPSDRCQ